MPYFACSLIIGEGSIHKTLANHDNGALNDYSLKNYPVDSANWLNSYIGGVNKLNFPVDSAV